MKIKDGFVLRKVSDQYMVIAIGKASINFHGMIKMNETAKDIWMKLSQGMDEFQIAKELSLEYGVDFDRVKKDVDNIVNQLKENDILE